MKQHQARHGASIAQPCSSTSEQAGLRVDLNHRAGNFSLRLKAQFNAKGITAVYGPSASGKSTLLNMIAGFSKPNLPSEVFFSKQAWLHSNGSSLPLHRRRLAYVTQHAALLPHLNVTENLNYGRQRNRLATAAPDGQPQFAALCRELELEHLQKKFPQQLSGGEQQRVAIGRALLANPQLILLDEPASALDESSRASTLASLERVLQHTRVPCIYVTHNLDELMRLADDVLCLRAGIGQQPLNLAQALCDPALPLSQQHGCGVILRGRLSASDSKTGTAQVTLPSQVVMRCALANANAQAGASVRLRIYAKDVSIALSKATDSSILNILPATVNSMCDYRTGQVLVELDCSGEKIMSIITAQSCNQLALRPGSKVYAQIKGIAVLGAGTP